MNETQETELREALSSLKEGEFLFLDKKHALGRWHETISSMAKRGLVKTEFLGRQPERAITPS